MVKKGSKNAPVCQFTANGGIGGYAYQLWRIRDIKCFIGADSALSLR